MIIMSVDKHKDEEYKFYKGNFIVPAFLLHSVDSKLYVLWLISDDLHRHRYSSIYIDQCPEKELSKYVEVSSIDYILLHDGKDKSISYHVEFGRGYRLPRFSAIEIGWK